MKKLLCVLIAVVALVGVLATPVLAVKGDNPANDNPNNLYLYQKDAGWNILWDGAWGKYNYKFDGTIISGVFNGHKLVPQTSYTLVEYNGWPSVTIIGTDVADEFGNVHISGVANIGSGGEVAGKYKIWLVLTSDLTGTSFNSWHPASYLFEHKLIP